MQELVKVMKRIEMFRGLNDAQLERLAQISRRQVYDEGSAIVSQDTDGDSLYIIVEGDVEVRARDQQGHDHSRVYLGEGQVFGEVALLDQGTRSASVLAASAPTVVYMIPRDVFNRVCQEDTALGYIVMRNLAIDLAFKLRHKNADTTN